MGEANSDWDSTVVDRAMQRRRGPLPVIGRAIEPVYRWVVARKNARFDAGVGVRRFDVPVISIGNLSVGGTGKTPLVMHALRTLMQAGRRPCVAMRGYSKGGDGAPDETDAYARAFPGMPIVAQADRIAGLERLLGSGREDATRSVAVPKADCIVLDDGFQHRQIARDVDVVLVDATRSRSVFTDRCLPAGWLREPVESLRRASIVVLTHAELASPEWIGGLKREIGARTSAPVAVTRHVWTGLRQRIGGEDRMLPLDVLIGKSVTGCCAIGHPSAFAASLERVVNGPNPETDRVGMLALPDHDPFGPARVKALAEMARVCKAAFIVVTDKDWSKLRGLPDSTWPCPVVRPELAVVFDEGREVFEGMVVRAGRGT